jgi:hypothetical protein
MAIWRPNRLRHLSQFLALDHQHHRGGEAETCPVKPELNELSLAAARAVRGGVIVVDILEGPQRGFLINEVNHTMEFHSTVTLIGVDIPGMLVDYTLSTARTDDRSTGALTLSANSLTDSRLTRIIP